MRYGIHKDTRDRLRDCSRRKGLSVAEIVRRAHRWHASTRPVLPLVPIPDDCRVVIEVANLPYANASGPKVDVITNAYLDAKDDGKANPVTMPADWYNVETGRYE